MSHRVFIVMLRRPDKGDARTDPYWEFGSFGCTGCHRANLLSPKRSQIRDGDRLAFVQGGDRGSRLLLVTPPVRRINHLGGGEHGLVELRWDPSQKPFRYDRAPSLFEPPALGAAGLLPRLADSLVGTNRTTIDAKFASRFRARTTPLDATLAEELEAGYARAVSAAGPEDFISSYADALPWCDCPTPPSQRRQDYLDGIENLGGERPSLSGRGRCSR